jgi:hypothetical protein
MFVHQFFFSLSFFHKFCRLQAYFKAIREEEEGDPPLLSLSLSLSLACSLMVWLVDSVGILYSKNVVI